MAVADELAKKQKEISISEFFIKNRHLLGFDNPRKALLTTIKEAVDNSLDACEEARVLPDIDIQIKQTGENRFIVVVEDNGPGIVRAQIPKIFAKLLYGSKFHTMRQSRGQQGIGISAAAMYGQLTTGKPIKIVSKIGPKSRAYYYELHMDTRVNEPEIVKEEIAEWDKNQGTKIEIEIEAIYQKNRQTVNDYLKRVAIANPAARIVYKNPGGEKILYERAVNELPKLAKEIKPHPYGIELGMLIKVLKTTKARTLQAFFINDFTRAGGKVAKEICKKANIDVKTKPAKVSREEADRIFRAIKETKIRAPSTNCLSSIGEEAIVKGLKKEIKADFYAAVTRSPAVYRGNPFQIEAGIVFGGELERDKPIKLMRYANRVPLLYQQSACAITRGVTSINWRNYGLSQSRGALPVGPMTLFIHIVSVWVPFTSESKESIAHYPEIIKQIRLALQDVGRKLGGYIRKNIRVKAQKERASLFDAYIPELASSLAKLANEKREIIEKNLKSRLKKDLPLLIGEYGKKKQD